MERLFLELFAYSFGRPLETSLDQAFSLPPSLLEVGELRARVLVTRMLEHVLAELILGVHPFGERFDAEALLVRVP